MLFVCHSAICIIIFTKYSNLLLDNINIFYYIIGEHEYDLFQTFRDSLFSYLDKCSQINAKKKDFIKG